MFVYWWLFLAHVALPLFLYFCCFRVYKGQVNVRKKSFAGAIMLYTALGFTARYTSKDEGMLLIVSTLSLLSMMKLLRLASLQFDSSVLLYPDRFLLFFTFPSNIRFIDSSENKETPSGLLYIRNGLVELCLSCGLFYSLQKLYFVCPFLYSFHMINNVLQTVIVYLQVRAYLNGVLVGVTKLIFGNAIIIEETWENLAKAYTLQQIWQGWNTGVHQPLKECIFIPLVKRFCTKNRRLWKTLLVMGITFAISGVVHEYTMWVRLGVFSGNQFFFFMLQFVGILFERLLCLHKKRKFNLHHVFGRLFLFSWLCITLPYFLQGTNSPMKEFLAG